MAIPEEIEQLKIKLEKTVDEKEQAEILMEILNTYASINSTNSKTYVDRLLRLAEKRNEPLYKAWGLHHLAILKRNKGEHDVSMDLFLQAIPLFERLKDKSGIAGCYGGIGIVYVTQGNYPEALRNYFVSLKIKEEIGNISGIANSYTNIGIAYYRQGNYPEALKNYFVSLKLYGEIGNKPGIGSSYGNIGIVYVSQGNYPEAIKNYSASLKLYEEIGNKSGIADVYNNSGNIYFKQGNYPEALKNYSASMKLLEEIGNKAGIAASYCNIANVYHSQGNYPETLKGYFASLKLMEEIGDKLCIASCYGNIGIVYQKQGNYAEAFKTLLLAIERSEEIGSKEMIKESALLLAQLYKATTDFENALKYHEKYHLVESEILGEQARKKLTNLNFQHHMEQQEKDLEIEQLRNVELKKERDRSENLLLNILPFEVAKELKDKGKADAKLFNDVTVLFTDFKGFTSVSERLTSQQLVDELHACFSAFDEIVSKYNIEKIKTVGDAYLAVSGLPIANPNHANDVIKAAIEIRDFIANRKKESDAKASANGGLGAAFEIRIGIHSGSVVAGIVGIKKFAYDIWGDAVNIAARMEQNSEAGKINISEATYQLLQGSDIFRFQYRGEIAAKNKEKLKMYYVL